MCRKQPLTQTPSISSRESLLTPFAWFSDCILGEAHKPPNRNIVAMTFEKQMYYDNLLANFFPQFSLQMFKSALEDQ